MRNIDHRKERFERMQRNKISWLARKILSLGLSKRPPGFKNTRIPGGRVRELNVSRNYPGLKSIVIKRDDFGDAKSLIDTIRNMVEEHNRNPAERYALFKPHAYAISQELIAMAKTENPTINEVAKQNTERGKKMARKLEKHGLTREKLFQAVEELDSHPTPFVGTHRNFMVLGAKDGKLLLMPFLDIW